MSPNDILEIVQKINSLSQQVILKYSFADTFEGACVVLFLDNDLDSNL